MALARMHAVVLDCPDPARLAAFYCELVGGELTPEPWEAGDNSWVTLVVPADTGNVRISFQRAPDHVRPSWPDPRHPQQFHLDVDVADLDAGEKQALELGATKAENQPSPDNYRVLLDPAGHPFCLCR